jgi:hypothetical protein
MMMMIVSEKKKTHASLLDTKGREIRRPVHPIRSHEKTTQKAIRHKKGWVLCRERTLKKGPIRNKIRKVQSEIR